MLKMKDFAVAVLCCMLLFAFTICEAAGRDSQGSAAGIARSEIWQAINSGRCGSATAAIMVDGTMVFAEGFGMADREKGIPVDKDTLFNMGSISKVYTASAIMLLVDEGKVSLDRPVTEYLPEFRMADKRYREITVRMALNHSSGLPGTEGSNTFGFKRNSRAMEETLETLAHSHLKHAPGEKAVYCNDGFSLAEMIVERVSGKNFSTFLSERIFKPLDLKNTGVSVGEISDKIRAAYYNPETGKSEPFEAVSILGAGGLSTTASDLCRFLDTFSSQNKIFTMKSLEEMKKAQPPAFLGKLKNPDVSCGLGWDMTNPPTYRAAGLQVLGKNGGTGNYSSMCVTVPDRRISVAVIASGPQSGATEIALHILDAVLADRGLMKKNKKSPSLPLKPERIPQALLSFAGCYASENAFGQMAFNNERNTVTFTQWKDGTRTPRMSLIYHKGYFYDTRGNRSYFASIDHRDYFVNSISSMGFDTISMQKVRPLDKPNHLRLTMNDRLWLRRNTRSYEGTGGMNTHMAKSLIYKELPGYVYFMGIKRIEGPDFAGMPFDAVRDQTELALLDRGGVTWARVSDLLFSPAEGTRALKPGENTVKIGVSGYDEWLKADEDMILSFAIPAGSRVIVFSPDRSAEYDSAVDTGDVLVRKGSFIEFEGSANDVFKVKGMTGARGICGRRSAISLLSARW